MTNAKEIMAAAQKVVEYAKSLGFTEAGLAYWDKDNSEYGYTSEEPLLEDAGGDVDVDLGVFLKNPIITFEQNYDEEKDEYSWRLTP